MGTQKGISPIIGYVLAILLSVIVIAAVAILFNNFYKTILEDEVRRELTQVAAQTSSKITEVYSLSKSSKASPGMSTSVLLADSKLNLPRKVADRSYEVTLLSPGQIATFMSNVTLSGQNLTFTGSSQAGKVVAETTEEPFVLVEYDLPNIDVDVQGRSDDPLNATLRYYRYNPNGTVMDTIILGEYSLIGQITAVS